MTTVRQLIEQAYFTASIKNFQLESVGPGDMAIGLQLLNEVADEVTKLTGRSSYTSKYLLTIGDGLGVDGSSEEYFIPGLVELFTVTYTLGSVRYALYPEGRQRYLASARVNNVKSLPSKSYYERVMGGANLFFYALPSQNFEATLYGKFSIGPFSYTDDLSITLEPFFIKFFRYSVAQELARMFGYSLSPDINQEISDARKRIAKISPKDMQVNFVSSFGNRSGISYPDANIGQGWGPPPYSY